jgi:hypothetical protein
MEAVIVLIIIALCAWFFRSKKKLANPYVEFHKLKIKNDNNYDEYLKWCYDNSVIPMDKYDYIKEITDKENQIKEAVK